MSVLLCVFIKILIIKNIFVYNIHDPTKSNRLIIMMLVIVVFCIYGKDMIQPRHANSSSNINKNINSIIFFSKFERQSLKIYISYNFLLQYPILYQCISANMLTKYPITLLHKINLI